ncbi:MAG: N-acetyl-gamma-glutamyl-phosphate reductase [Spirochaetales bacterium]|nr:N-acetyl-gamma-glutamyl-phosphate reductase [Spirochaetales bacterium]
MKVAILGTTGYTGQILLRLLAQHPSVDHIFPVSSSSSGTHLLELDPGLGDRVLAKTKKSGGQLVDISTAVQAHPEVVFAALPHLKSAEVCSPFFGSSVVIDLSADFRISDPQIFFEAYKQAPPREDLLSQAVYGLTEWMEEPLRRADLIANPGCYPTATLLPLLPLVKAGWIEGDIIVNALSGISGAGKKASEYLLFCTRTENVNAYSPGRSHRHTQEIQQEVNRWGSGTSSVFFTPHLVPIKQGMAVTSTLKLSRGISDRDIDRIYDRAYEDRPWVRRTTSIPQTAQVRGTNRCDFSVHRDGDRLFLTSVIDNLYKGASGQAVQNMNVRFDLEQTLGLPDSGDL